MANGGDSTLHWVQRQKLACRFAPVECFYTGDDEPMVYIDPNECIDCGACVPECPTEAIFLPRRCSGPVEKLHRTERFQVGGVSVGSSLTNVWVQNRCTTLRVMLSKRHDSKSHATENYTRDLLTALTDRLLIRCLSEPMARMRRFVAEATGVTAGLGAAVDRWIPTALPGPSAAKRRIRARGSPSAT